jgi:ribosomal protein S18 acetylase RimI-like enzyme
VDHSTTIQIAALVAAATSLVAATAIWNLALTALRNPSLLHISMVFVRPAAQRSGVGLPLVLHVLDVAGSHGYQRVAVWTAEDNTPARGLYERAGMSLIGKSAPFHAGTQLQYGCLLNGEP